MSDNEPILNKHFESRSNNNASKNKYLRHKPINAFYTKPNQINADCNTLIYNTSQTLLFFNIKYGLIKPQNFINLLYISDYCLTLHRFWNTTQITDNKEEH